MSQKAEKPVLSGQRIKTRKRDEKEKYDPTGFRDAIISGLEKQPAGDLDAVSKFLDGAGNKLDYRRYGECLFDILIAGGLLVPGGTLSQDGEGPFRTAACIFNAPPPLVDLDLMKSWEQVFVKLMRRYKYLEKIFQDEIKKILMFIKYFSAEDRLKLSVMISLWIVDGSIPFSAVLVLSNPHLVKDNLSLNFLIDMFKFWRVDKGITSLHSAIKKSNIESHLQSFVPDNKHSQQYFKTAFHEAGLDEILKLYDDQHQQVAKKELKQLLLDSLNEDKSTKETVLTIKEFAQKENIQEHEIVCIIWTTIMGQAEWNKKEELLAEQAIRHLKTYTSLLYAFTTQARSELNLLLKVQEFCYSNMVFMRTFKKIVVLLYNAEVISEQVILKWYSSDYNVKGKMMFVDQMKTFVEWLSYAETDSSTDTE